MVYRREIAHAVYRVNRAVAGAIAAIPMRAGYQYLLISPRFYFGIAQPDSYAFQTIDYLLKPITLKRFLSATQKIEAAFGKQPVAESKPDEGYFFVKTGKTLRKILLDEVLYFEGEKEYVRMVTGAEVLLIYRRLKDIEEQLSSPFVRVHNSYIVNTKLLSKIQDNHIYIGDKQIPVSEKFRDGFMAVIKERMF
ncbi:MULTISPECIES: LytTR family DNA-binding domain-containing protein [unclassified Mucilaginibacter]|uniref:LytR/AlgR family response regulator transcription factor n=1 Tax=unclassified Mucilaginibacter TaxID=2617802 RepID=UPI002AC93C61|nr:MULTISPECIES: LytTR family DNA-binding domain-containing protein [unclassified Mucilaginibacter]MEB0262232.1 LytTR family DNA-binding domain-containing protein [Mucilaginibacter sp. 10I4]MEB0278653.1 LytTR family DNA-binding domain-containing protein [Mucilaginibacter sp. 10B2]MEB0299363.1 LytTR family DNA-binding domain-containing protein [Mucilaginibacter sp. 5C4]WPX23393.1 LytTR family DNA-binding domain-containing protein [Mucilaginibacter sp. 5C4]